MAKQQPAASVSGKKIKEALFRNRYYLLAFFIPIVLMYIAYAIFGLYPFGKESVLALDLNAQYIYYFEALRDNFWGDGSAFYNWSRNLSGGFMGIIGYYLASPFTLIVMILPRKMILTSLLLMILAKIGSASLTFCIYLQHSRKLAPLPSVMFSISFALCSYMVIQTVNPMWLDGLVFLPLIVLGLERMIDTGHKLGFIIPTAMMFIANFYIGYMIAFFVFFYFIYYLIFGTDQRRGRFSDYAFICLNFLLSVIVILMLSAVMLLPVYNALSLGKFSFTPNPDYSFKTQFTSVDILAQLLTCQYDSVNVQGSPEIYCGILAVVLLPLYYLSSRISLRRKIGRTALLMVMFFSMYIKPLDMWWHGGQVPNWLPYRYSFIIAFLLLSTAAASFQSLDGMKRSCFTGTFVGILVTVLYLQGREYAHLGDISSVWLSIGLAAVYLTFLFYIGVKGETKTLPILVTIVLSGELVFNAVHSLRSLDKEVTYSTKASYENFMENGRKTVEHLESRDDGLYRAEKTFTRCINDNIGWGLRGLTHSSSVMNARILTFIETLGYNTRSYYSRYEGTTELADSLLGIKYVIDRDDAAGEQALAEAQGSELDKIDLHRRWLLHEAYPEVDHYTFTDTSGDEPIERTYTIHENPNALPIAYMASADLKRVDHLGNDNPFNSQNVLLSTLAGRTTFDAEGHFADYAQYYTRITTEEPVLGAVTLGDYNGQACYTKTGTGDPTVDYRFTVESEEEIFCFLKTENEQAVNLWLGVYDEATDSYRFGASGYGKYFETSNYSIISLGRYTPGTRVALRLTVLDKDNATIIKEPYFYYFNRDAFQQDIDQLKTQGMYVTKYNATSIQGTVAAKENQLLFTTIPYEPGWTVRVDGVKQFTTGSSDTEIIKHKDESGKTWTERKEKHMALKSMIYIPLEPGEHTITMSYTAPGFVPGVLLFVLGIGFVCVIWWYDRNHAPVLRKKRSEKKTA